MTGVANGNELKTVKGDQGAARVTVKAYGEALFVGGAVKLGAAAGADVLHDFVPKEVANEGGGVADVHAGLHFDEPAAEFAAEAGRYGF
ncbi:hypothetical protein GCM10010841_32010 [Deinococcus aerophilus]|uniref:Uncharacterized protein n=1 Tax=Deinococcus aerophilus TaxID=522488 RepID=A0ABQ2H0S8_9DEIO|nr:hypothetical protein GCM10010841_32010 [Deinococcus aerophilus]